MDERKNWFEITTYPNDPSRIEMRRLSDEEAAQAISDAAEELAKQWIQAMGLLDDAVSKAANEINKHDLGRVYIDPFGEDSAQPDPKVEARRRSKEDLRRKRKDMMKRGGQI